MIDVFYLPVTAPAEITGVGIQKEAAAPIGVTASINFLYEFPNRSCGAWCILAATRFLPAASASLR